ncbi:unnamed protein product [Amoebophrya sp. A120]|nr:unnamed protein product [Amoebophrya sp. A120]|eukprot:GSA120T00000675001.1
MMNMSRSSSLPQHRCVWPKDHRLVPFFLLAVLFFWFLPGTPSAAVPGHVSGRRGNFALSSRNAPGRSTQSSSSTPSADVYASTLEDHPTPARRGSSNENHIGSTSSGAGGSTSSLSTGRSLLVRSNNPHAHNPLPEGTSGTTTRRASRFLSTKNKSSAARTSQPDRRLTSAELRVLFAVHFLFDEYDGEPSFANTECLVCKVEKVSTSTNAGNTSKNEAGSANKISTDVVDERSGGHGAAVSTTTISDEILNTYTEDELDRYLRNICSSPSQEQVGRGTSSDVPAEGPEGEFSGAASSQDAAARAAPALDARTSVEDDDENRPRRERPANTTRTCSEEHPATTYSSTAATAAPICLLSCGHVVCRSCAEQQRAQSPGVQCYICRRARNPAMSHRPRWRLHNDLAAQRGGQEGNDNPLRQNENLEPDYSIKLGSLLNPTTLFSSRGAAEEPETTTAGGAAPETSSCATCKCREDLCPWQYCLPGPLSVEKDLDPVLRHFAHEEDVGVDVDRSAGVVPLPGTTGSTSKRTSTAGEEDENQRTPGYGYDKTSTEDVDNDGEHHLHKRSSKSSTPREKIKISDAYRPILWRRAFRYLRREKRQFNRIVASDHSASQDGVVGAQDEQPPQSMLNFRRGEDRNEINVGRPSRGSATSTSSTSFPPNRSSSRRHDYDHSQDDEEDVSLCGALLQKLGLTSCSESCGTTATASSSSSETDEGEMRNKSESREDHDESHDYHDKPAAAFYTCSSSRDFFPHCSAGTSSVLECLLGGGGGPPGDSMPDDENDDHRDEVDGSASRGRANTQRRSSTSSGGIIFTSRKNKKRKKKDRPSAHLLDGGSVVSFLQFRAAVDLLDSVGFPTVCKILHRSALNTNTRGRLVHWELQLPFWRMANCPDEHLFFGRRSRAGAPLHGVPCSHRTEEEDGCNDHRGRGSSKNGNYMEDDYDLARSHFDSYARALDDKAAVLGGERAEETTSRDDGEQQQDIYSTTRNKCVNFWSCCCCCSPPTVPADVEDNEDSPVPPAAHRRSSWQRGRISTMNGVDVDERHLWSTADDVGRSATSCTALGSCMRSLCCERIPSCCFDFSNCVERYAPAFLASVATMAADVSWLWLFSQCELWQLSHAGVDPMSSCLFGGLGGACCSVAYCCFFRPMLLLPADGAARRYLEPVGTVTRSGNIQACDVERDCLVEPYVNCFLCTKMAVDAVADFCVYSRDVWRNKFLPTCDDYVTAPCRRCCSAVADQAAAALTCRRCRSARRKKELAKIWPPGRAASRLHSGDETTREVDVEEEVEKLEADVAATQTRSQQSCCLSSPSPSSQRNSGEDCASCAADSTKRRRQERHFQELLQLDFATGSADEPVFALMDILACSEEEEARSRKVAEQKLRGVAERGVDAAGALLHTVYALQLRKTHIAARPTSLPRAAGWQSRQHALAAKLAPRHQTQRRASLMR